MERRSSLFRGGVILAALLAAILACSKAPDYELRGWTATPSATDTLELPTQTPRIVQVEVTAPPLPSPTATPFAPRQMTVRSHSWNCYDAPTGKPIAALRAGDVVTVIAERDGWAQLAASGVRPGCWVVAAALK